MDGFNDRVGKVFDCLSSSSSSSKGAAWSLSDAQIQRQTWNRDKGNKSDIISNKDDDETLVSSSFDNLFKQNKSNNKKRNNNTFDDPDDDDDDERIDDLDVRSSIGLDPTLDFEEEEDEYDKIAAGTENAAPHLLYMKDVTNHAPFLNSHNVLQHHTLLTTTHSNNDNDDDDDQPMFNVPPPKPLVDHVLKVKSILKRKTEELGKSSAKRVRFDPTCKEHDAPQVDGFSVPQVSKNRPGVPDYILNPRKYTRYTFNDDDDDKRSNTEAYLDFLEQVKKSKDVGLEQKSNDVAELPASVVFIPRKKRGDGVASNSEGQVKESSSGVGISIAAVEVQQDEVSDVMLQDEPDVDAVCDKPPKFQKASRQYRSKVEDDDSVC